MRKTNNAGWHSGRRIQGTLLGVEVSQTPDGQELPHAFIVPSYDSGLPDGTVLKVLLPNSAHNSENMQLNMAAVHDGYVRNLNTKKTLEHFIQSSQVLRQSGTHVKPAGNKLFTPLYVSDAQGKSVRLSPSDMVLNRDLHPTRQMANYLLGQRSLAHAVEQLSGRHVPFFNNRYKEHDVESLYEGVNKAIDKHGAIFQVAVDNFMPVGNDLTGGGYRHPLQGQTVCIDNIKDGAEPLMEQGQRLTATVLAGVATNLTVTNDPCGIVNEQKTQEQLSFEHGESRDEVEFANGDKIEQLVGISHDTTQQTKPLFHIGIPDSKSIERGDFQAVSAKAGVAVATKQSNVISVGFNAKINTGTQPSFSKEATPFLHEIYEYINDVDDKKFGDKEMASGAQPGLLISVAGQAGGRLHMAGGANFVFKQDARLPHSFSEQAKNELIDLLNLTHPAFANYIPHKIYEKIQQNIHGIGNDGPSSKPFRTPPTANFGLGDDQSPHGKVFYKYANIVNDNKKFFYEATRSFVANEANQNRPEYSDLRVFAQRMAAYENDEVREDGLPQESIGVYNDFIRYIKKEPALFAEITASIPEKHTLNRSMENLVLAGTQMEKDYLAALAVYQAIKNEALENNLVENNTLTLGVGEDAIQIPVPKTFTQADFFNGVVKEGQNTITFKPLDPTIEHDPKERKNIEAYNAKLKEHGDDGKKLVFTDASHRGFSNNQHLIAGLVFHSESLKNKVNQEQLDKTSPLNNPTLITTQVKIFESGAQKELNQLLNSKIVTSDLDDLAYRYPELQDIGKSIMPSGQSFMLSKRVDGYDEILLDADGAVIQKQGAAPLTNQRNTQTHLHASEVYVSNSDSTPGGEATLTAKHIESAKADWVGKNWESWSKKLPEAYDLFLAQRVLSQKPDTTSLSIKTQELYTLGSVTKTQVGKLTMVRNTSEPSFKPCNISFDEQGMACFSPVGAIPVLSSSSHLKGQSLADSPETVVYYEQDGKIGRAEYIEMGEQKIPTHASYLIEHRESVVETFKNHSDVKLMTPDYRLMTSSNDPNALRHCAASLFEARYLHADGSEARDEHGRLTSTFAVDFDNLPDMYYPYEPLFNPEKQAESPRDLSYVNGLSADWDDGNKPVNEKDNQHLMQMFGAESTPLPPQNNSSYDAPSPDF